MTKPRLEIFSKNRELILAFLLLLLVSLLAGQFRFIARDEGFYLYAARLISEGFLPYRDFFFPQTPFVPFLYAGWFWIFGANWISGRILASLLTVGAGLLLARYTFHHYGKRAGIFSLLLFTLSSSVQIWLPTAQTDSASVFLLLATFVAATVQKNYFWTGFLLGVTVLSRLTFAPAGAVLFLIVFFTKGPFSLSSRLARFGAGLLVPGVIAFGFYCLDPDNFIAHNLEYHLERTALTPEQLSSHRWKVFITLLGFRNGMGIGWLQFAVLFYTALAAFFVQCRLKKSPDPLALTGFILFATHLLPDPTYLQYFVITTVLLIPLSAHSTLSLCERTRFPQIASALACLLFGTLAFDDVERFFITGDKVIGVGTPNKDSWKISRIEEVSRAIDTFVTPDQKVFTSWPGYLVSSRAHAYPGTENHFAYTWAERQNFSEDEQDRKKIASLPRVVQAFKDGAISLAVLFIGVERTNALEHQIIRNGGMKMKALRGINIYKRGSQE